jgi:hypothetical protein
VRATAALIEQRKQKSRKFLKWSGMVGEHELATANVRVTCHIGSEMSLQSIPHLHDFWATICD